MEAFQAGEHVILELEGDRMVAGFLVDYLDDGWVLSVTHKEVQVVHAVSPEVKADIRDQLNQKSIWHLRAVAIASGSLMGLVAKKYDVVEYLAGQFEDKLLEKYTDTMQLRELKAPVKTMFSHGIIATMQSTADRNLQEELSSFDVDGTLEEILEAGLTTEEVPGKIEE
jgi:hypothetical protein